MQVAAESVRRKEKRRRYSHHPCPRCGKETMERRHLPSMLRTLRVLPGLHPRRYVCETCGRSLIIWNPPRG